MRNKGNIVAIFVILIALFLAGGLVFMNNLSKNTTNKVIDEASTQLEINQQTNSQPVAQSRYVDYSQPAFDQAADKKRVLYFHADWCPVCRPLNKEFIEKADQIPEDVVVFKTNYDTEMDLKKKYSITYQHTFVQVDANGNEVAKWSGGDFAEVLANVK